VSLENVLKVKELFENEIDITASNEKLQTRKIKIINILGIVNQLISLKKVIQKNVQFVIIDMHIWRILKHVN
jgi:N-acetylmuramic acid 6-phosphate (MurNAc-6-P) etherase